MAKAPESTSATITDAELPWRKKAGGEGEPIPHLVIVWSLEEPERIGEVLPIAGPCVIGRGGARETDPAPRANIFRQRPGASVPMHPLESSRISRVQLSIEPAKGGSGLAVKNVGQTALSCDGQAIESCLAMPGMTLALKNAITFLVVMRLPTLPALRGQASTRFDFGEPDANGIVGESAVAWALRDDLAFAATAPGHVLLRGASGVGKELAARSVHAYSDRSKQAFVARNAATFPEGLVDAELFGNVKNYPNPGMPERRGLVGEADGGTLFLDEIGELPSHLQAHLLRVLDNNGEYQRLGASSMSRTDARFVAATNRAIDALKHDFAARFPLRIEIPGLEARRDDIPLLARHILARAVEGTPALLERFAEQKDPKRVRLDPLLIEGLVRHAYTHHLRELQRLLLLALSTSRESFVALTPEVQSELRLGWQPVSEAAPPSELSREDIEAALAAATGNVTRAARALGLKNRFALYRLMKAKNIAYDEPAGSEDD